MFIWTTLVVSAINSHAQIGVTKYGTNALLVNGPTGDYNTGLGYFVLAANTSGNRNTGAGANALRFNTTGIYNTATGAAALYQTTTGSYNSGVGAYALFTNTTGIRNTAFGSQSLRLNTTGSDNTANGNLSLYNNTSGGDNNAEGANSLYNNTTGEENTANGLSAMYSNTIGSHNTAMGFLSLFENTSGYNNTAIGAEAMYGNTTGNHNTALGGWADVTSGNLHNATAIGYFTTVNASNKVRIGNSAVTSIGGQVGWTTFSDGRYKKDIKENTPGLEFINALRPVTYTVNVKGLHDYYSKMRRSNGSKLELTEDKAARAEMEQSEAAAARIVYNGFVAQEVESAAKKLKFEFSGVDKPTTEDGLYGLRYDNFISPIVKSVQELSVKNDKKDSVISNLENLIGSLQDQINDLKLLITKTGGGLPNTFSTGHLKQNAPNPFNSNTVISYYVPENSGHAQLKIMDVSGRVIKTFNAPRGEGKIIIRSGELAAGNYSYTLYVDNRTADTKQMLLIK